MEIGPTSIYVAVIIFCITLFRTFYFLFVNIKRYPTPLFRGRFLFLFLLNLCFEIGAVVLALFYSNNFFYVGIFFLWAVISGTGLCLYFVLWVIFWMHGYDPRYQFYKVVIPAPMSFLSSLTLLASGLCSLNYYLIALSLAYGFTSYLWNLKGYFLTKPKIPDYLPVPEDDSTEY